MYVILGCGTIGAHVVKGLRDRGEDAVGVDKDGLVVERLRARGLDVARGDITMVDLSERPFSDARAFIITPTEPKVAMAALDNVRRRDRTVPVLIISREDGGYLNVLDAATLVVRIEENVASDLLRVLDGHELKRRVDALILTIDAAGPDGIAVFLHDNPDPDAMAAAMAFQRICRERKVPAMIYHGGTLDHQQNREFVSRLGLELHAVKDQDEAMEMVGRHGKLAMLDVSLPGDNNVVPINLVPSIVIDHHGTARHRTGSEFVDVRPNVGATSTILTKFLQQLGLSTDIKLATALFFGIRTDTASFTRGVSPSDLMAVAFLSPFVFKPLLDLFESPPVPTATMDVIRAGLDERTVVDRVCVAWVGDAPDHGSIVQCVDFLAKEEGVETVIVAGTVGDIVHLSARNRTPGLDIGALLRRWAVDTGSAGGHATAGGGQLDPAALMGKLSVDREGLGRALSGSMLAAVLETRKAGGNV